MTESGVPKDIFQTAGIDMPRHLNTNSRRWASLWLITVFGVFVGGPLTNWPTIEPLLIDQGVWAGPDQVTKFTHVSLIAMPSAFLCVALAGLLYDALGARVIGSVSSFVTGMCMLVMAFAINTPSLNYLLWVAYPAALAISGVFMLVSMAFVWLLPEDSSTVSATSYGVLPSLQALSSLLAVFVHKEYGFQISSLLIVFSILSMIAGLLIWVIVPSRQELHRISSALIRFQAACESADASPEVSYEAPTPRLDGGRAPLRGGPQAQIDVGLVGSEEPEVSSVADALAASLASGRDALVVCTKVHKGMSWRFLWVTLAGGMFMCNLTADMFPLFRSLVGQAKTTELVDIFGGLSAFWGAGSALLFGRFMDLYGMVPSVGLIVLGVVGTCACFSMPSVPALICGQVLFISVSGAGAILPLPLLQRYCPPELLGAMNGLQCLVIGVSNAVLPMAISLIFGALHFAHQQRFLRYLLPLHVCGLLYVITGCWVISWWFYYPPPRIGSTTMSQVREASNTSAEAADESQDPSKASKRPLTESKQ